MTLEEQLKEFPEEFTLALERAKELQFPKVVNYGVEVFNIKDDVEAYNIAKKAIKNAKRNI